jgi:branched-chain amino acid transport system ATP-binding protein
MPSAATPMPSEPVRPEALVAEARCWLGTPFRHQGRIRGQGVDCIGLVLEPARALGLTDYRPGAYSRLPDAGTTPFAGGEITRLPAHERVRRGLCRTFQIVDVFPRLSVFENVQLAVITRKGGNLRFLRPAAGEEREEVGEALRAVGMWELRERRAEQLSHGQQRRLDLAISLATRPRLCFLDEPTSGVSPKERDQMLVLIRELAAGRDTTFVIVEHDMEVVFDISAWIAVMHRGRILAQGTPEEIRANREVREVYLGEEA